MNRLSTLRKSLSSDVCVLISNPVNVTYLSGFTGSNGLLLITYKEAILLTDARYTIQAKQEVRDFEVVIDPNIWQKIPSLLKDLKEDIKQLTVEANHITVSAHDSIVEALPKFEIVKQSDFVENLRQIKDQNEIDLIKTACEISTNALTNIINGKLIGKTEHQIAVALEREMVDLGATQIAFQTIVASGPNSAIPHHQPTQRSLQKGDFLKIDFGAQFKGYKSDCTRTFVLGSAAQWQKDMYEAVLVSQSMGRQLSVPGERFNNVDKAVRQKIADLGYADKFTHGLGHGVGLMIHENPFFTAKNNDIIAQNMVLTVEPGIYETNLGGVRIEDTGLITSAGYTVLTQFEYDLVELNT